MTATDSSNSEERAAPERSNLHREEGPEGSRVIYSTRPASQPLRESEELLLLRFIAEQSRRPIDDLEEDRAKFRKRSLHSYAAIAYLVPEGQSSRRYLQEQGYLVDGAQIVGTAFLGSTTGILHDLYFDHGAIEELARSTDRRAPELLLNQLLQGQDDRMIFAMAAAEDKILAEVLATAGLQELQEVDGGVLYGRSVSGIFETKKSEG